MSFKKLFTESNNTLFRLELKKEIKKKYGLKSLPVYTDDEFEPTDVYEKNSKNGKIRVYFNNVDYNKPVYNFEYI